MKYYVIAGEASGDLHGSNLIKELMRLEPASEFRGWGGDKMKQAGTSLVRHYRDLAFMGFTEVFLNLGTIFRNLKFCKDDILQYKPDALILIDYPGFNLRIANWAKRQNLFSKSGSKIIFYISPQVWAWKENRVKEMMRCIDKMMVILPFEKDYYKKKWNWDVEYVGHPLVDVIEEYKRSGKKMVGENNSDNREIIGLLPGSRKQEISKKLPVMLEMSKIFPRYQFVVAAAPSIEDEFYEEMLSPYPGVNYVKDKTYDILSSAKAALVTSGTATLETALFGVPEVVCYKGSFISYQIGKRLVRVKYISLVNLIMDKLVVKELIQDDFTIENLQRELEDILQNEKRIAQLNADYRALKDLLGQMGNASATAASSITQFLR